MRFLDLFQGEMMIESISIQTENDELNIIMDIYCKNKKQSVSFYNASGISLDNLSFPIVVQGFEIIDNHQRGWEKDRRYLVHDYEDGLLQFYCREIKQGKPEDGSLLIIK